jgi:hypothetical protein
MAKNESDEDLLASVVDPDDQAALVIADVEDSASPNNVRIPPSLLYVREV